MNYIRYGASVLLLVSGVSHVFMGIRNAGEIDSLALLVFGIFYATIGVMLVANLQIAPLLGIIFPLIGLATGIFVTGISHWSPLLTTLFSGDVVVMIGCVILFTSQHRHSRKKP